MRNRDQRRADDAAAEQKGDSSLKIEDGVAAVATHEAGHCVAARVLNLVVRRASASEDDPGVITRYRVDVPPAELAATLEKLILVDLAGPLAEYRVTGRSDGHAWLADERNALSRALRLLGLDHAELDDSPAELVERLRPRAAALVAENWAQIERVAAALAAGGVLTQSDVDALIAAKE
jgi:hypothetical protein